MKLQASLLGKGYINESFKPLVAYITEEKYESKPIIAYLMQHGKESKTLIERLLQNEEVLSHLSLIGKADAL